MVHSSFFAGWEERRVDHLPVGDSWSVCGTVSRSINTVCVCVCPCQVNASAQMCPHPSVLTGTCCHCHNGSVTVSTNATDDLRLNVLLIQESKRWETCIFSVRTAAFMQCVCFIYSECVFVHTSVSPALRQTSRKS